jgi:hypothetical protein
MGHRRTVGTLRLHCGRIVSPVHPRSQEWQVLAGPVRRRAWIGGHFLAGFGQGRLTWEIVQRRRYQLVATNTGSGQVAWPDARHRSHVHVENDVKQATTSA